MFKKIHTIFFLLLLITKIVCARETLNYQIHNQYTTPRSLGAGGTFSGVDGYNVMFFNPAGLAHLKEGEFNFGLGASTSMDTLDFTEDVKNIVDKDIPEADKITEASDLLIKYYGDVFSARLPKTEFIYSRPRWAVGLIPTDLSVALLPKKLGGPALDVTAYQDTTLAFGWAKKSNRKRAAWGFLGKAIYRAKVEKSLIALDLIQDDEIVRDEDYKEGLALDLDIGVEWAPWRRSQNRVFRNVAWPVFSAVVRNAFDMGYISNFEVYNDNSKDPDDLQRRLDIGIKLDGKDFKAFQPQLMIDFRNILHEDYSFEKGLHLGTELKYNFGSLLKGSLQAGLNQMYWTAGIGLQTLFMKFELATYAEEYGTKSEKKTNRQYIGQFNINF